MLVGIFIILIFGFFTGSIILYVLNYEQEKKRQEDSLIQEYFQACQPDDPALELHKITHGLEMITLKHLGREHQISYIHWLAKRNKTIKDQTNSEEQEINEKCHPE